MDRRSFIKRSAAGSAAAFLGTSLLGREVLAGHPAKAADISIVTGKDFYASTIEAVRIQGGMHKFVKEGDRVGLLTNADFDQAGAYVHPDISIAAIKMCFDAGASEVLKLQAVKPEYWTRSAYFAGHEDMIGRLQEVKTNVFPAEFNEEEWMRIPKIEGARCLGEVEVIRALNEVDVLINIFIAKHHASTLYTGALKNSMGFCTRKTNVFYHLGSGERNDPEFLAQCIADINLLRQPDLIIGDATSFIITNGPSGPGEVKEMNKVFAGTSLVAMDALGASYNDIDPADVLTIVKASSSGLGSYDLTEMNCVDISL